MAKFNTGDMVRWQSSGGTAEGEIVRVQESGRLAIPDSDFVLNATEDNPAYLIRLYRDGNPTDILVGHREDTLNPKSMNAYQYKGIPAQVKDIDVKNGIVTGYFSQFGEVDSDGDMIVKGAFSKSIMENGPESQKQRIVHLYQHDVSKPLGKPYMLKEDEYGLYFESKIVETSYGQDVLKLYEAGVINEHSIGFVTVKGQPKEGYMEIQEVKLFEGSTVTFGANENTPFTGFKNMDKESATEQVRRLTKAVRNGTFTDETFHLLEIQLKQLEQFIIDSLYQTPEPPQGTPVEVEPKEIEEAFEAFAIQLINPKL